MGRVQDKVAIVTGAASGIGRASAALLAREGAKVVLVDINDADGEQAAEEIAAAGHSAMYRHLDVTVEEDWTRVVDECVSLYGGLNVLVNNAVGETEIQDFEDTEPEQWRRQTAVILDALYLGTRAVLLHMRRSGSGSIINVSSGAGIVGMPRLATYSGAKGGVRLFSKAIAIELGQKGDNIRVNSVHPGFILTPPMQREGAKLFPGLDKEQAFARMAQIVPMQRLGQPDEIANGILFLASEEASYITGSELVIDGGYTSQ